MVRRHPCGGKITVALWDVNPACGGLWDAHAPLGHVAAAAVPAHHSPPSVLEFTASAGMFCSGFPSKGSATP
jgi:hypothetical protein